MLIKHSKYKNTGILFELLVRQITSDTLSGKDSKATNILKKYFNKTELGREYKLYESLLKRTNLTEGKANIILNTVLETSKQLNKSSLKRQKYNLIKEIKEHYNLEEFFKTKLHNYKAQASLYTLIESYGDKSISAEQTIDNKLVILEHLTFTASKKENKTETIIEEFSKYDKDTRILTYKILLDKFNDKYSDFSTSKKSILKEYINSVDNPSKLKDFYNITINEIKKDIIVLNKTTKNEVVKIKLEETIKNLLNQLGKNDKVTNDHIVNLLQYCDLLEELKQVNGKQ
jgi:hypothetical protein